MSVATAYATWLQGAKGTSSRSRPTSRAVWSARRWWAGPTSPSTRRASAAGWPSSTAGSSGRRTKRITILLSPADLAKRGTHFDLAIAVAVLAAARQGQGERWRESLFMGELTLSGGLRSRARACCRWCWRPLATASARCSCPSPRCARRRWCPASSCSGCVRWPRWSAQLNDEAVPEAPPVAGLSSGRLASWRGQSRLDELDLLDVDGMADAKYAMEVAAAGGHHVMLTWAQGRRQDHAGRAAAEHPART